MRSAYLLGGLAPLLAAACHDLPDLGTCGNGIIEEANGEACDDNGDDTPTCSASCQLKCTEGAVKGYVQVPTSGTSATAAYCPSDQFRCGTDRICRAPSGSFEPLAPPQTFNIGGFPVVGDADHDGLPDLIGTSATNIYIRFASAFGAPLGDVVVQDTPSSEAAYVIFDRDPNGSDPARSDMMIGVPTEGLALLRSDNERFEPELELELRGIGTDPLGLVVHDPDPTVGEVIVTVQHQSTTPTILVTRIAVPSPMAAIEPSAPPLVAMAQLPACVGAGAAAWSAVKVVAAPDRRSFTVITQSKGGPEWRVCRYTPAGPGSTWSVDQIELPGGTRPTEAVLANVDADPCLELLMTNSINGAPEVFELDAAGPSCAFAGSVPLPRLTIAPLTAMPLPAVLAAGQIDPATPLDEIVLSKGVYRACTGAGDCEGFAPGTYVLVAAPTKVPWHAAALVDLDDDGVLDVVAARGGEADVDVARGGATPAVYRVSTGATILNLVAGDYDGDGLGDVAMVKVNAQAGDQLAVMFGAREGAVQAPVTMSGPGGHLVLDRLHDDRWLPSRRGNDGFDDLLVLDTDTRRVGGAAVGLVLGDAARLMTTPRFPPVATTNNTIAGLAAGTFRNGKEEILAVIDSQVLLYDVVGMPPAVPPSWSPPISAGMPLFAPVATLQNGTQPARAVVSLTQPGPMQTTSDLAVFSVSGGTFSLQCKLQVSGQLRGLRGVDLDGDGIDEVVVLASTPMGMGMTPPPTLQVFDGGDCRERLADVLGGCADVASFGDRLVAICRPTGGAAEDLLILGRTGDDQYTLLDRLGLQGDGRFVTFGDFDGDGVPDAAVGVRRVDAVGVQLMRQCPAHDKRTCATPR